MFYGSNTKTEISQIHGRFQNASFPLSIARKVRSVWHVSQVAKLFYGQEPRG
jgi:hypothetical protein